MKVKRWILEKVLRLLFIAFIVSDIYAQKDESWEILNLEEFSLSIPKYLNEHF